MASGESLSFVLGRLYEAVEHSSVITPWLGRSRIDAAVRLLHADGVGVDRERVLRHSYELPLPQRSDADGQVAALLARLSAPTPDDVADELSTAISRAD